MPARTCHVEMQGPGRMLPRAAFAGKVSVEKKVIQETTGVFGHIVTPHLHVGQHNGGRKKHID